MSKTTIYAKTLNPEDFDYRIYDIREDDGNEVFILGGRDFCDIDNKDYLKKIKELKKSYNSWEYEDYYHNKIMDLLYDMLPKKENGKGISKQEAHKIANALYDDEEDNIICMCLTVITGKKYLHAGLRGCCQGDYVDAYYPEDTSQEYIDFVEAWYFGTGTEVIIHDCNNIPQCAEEVEGYSFYTGEWWCYGKELKKIIKRQCGYKEDDKDVEVKLWLYKDSYRVRHDNYEEAD